MTAAVVGLASSVALADRMDMHSFEAPYTHVDPSGSKSVSKDWKTGGVTTVNKNFVRLTPDRQSKKGALWSRKSLNTNTFSTVFSFRISGQGKKFFGDGMGLWFIQQAYYVEGDFHGSVERFTGFGIIFDTFKNTETLSYHRDISIVFNDGEKTAEFMMEKNEGCDANIRYHEERGDFSVDSLSRAKVVLENGRKVTVLVDAKNAGDFVECATMELPMNNGKKFGENWAKSAHIGVTASTGQLADNHDVLSLVTYADIEAHGRELVLAKENPSHRSWLAGSEEMPVVGEARFKRLEDKVSELLEKLDFLQHHLEHELASVEDHNKVTISKLQSQEAVSEGRITELEQRLSESIGTDLHGRMGQLSSNMNEEVVRRIAAVETVMHGKINDSIEAVAANVSGGGWKLPFLFLTICMGGGAFALYKWYRQLKKTHML
jgi:mannose-binding lectin 2